MLQNRLFFPLWRRDPVLELQFSTPLHGVLLCFAEQRCVALTDDGVHAAAMLLGAYRAGAECRLSQADAAWVRNVIADTENFLPDLLREVP